MSQITIQGVPAAALKRLDDHAMAMGRGRDEVAASALLAGIDSLGPVPKLRADPAQPVTEAKPKTTSTTTTPRRKRKERT